MKGKTLVILLAGTFVVGVILQQAISVSAQTAEFTYQGRLVDGSLPANASYDLEFKLFDVAAGGTEIGTQTRSGVSVSNGIFTVLLDFGGLAAFRGDARWLEIAVKPAGSPNPYTVLSPRQPVSSAPYSIRSSSAATAELSLNSNQLGGTAANQFVRTTDTRLSDDRNPLPNSANYIQNTASQQTASNFNIAGSGTANIFNAAAQYNIGGSRVLAASSFSQNVFAGFGSGASNGLGAGNSFFGTNAGFSTVSGGNNSFFGRNAGQANTAASNSFFGENSGFGTTTGGSNSFFGQQSGRNNSTGADNAFFGFRAGFNNTGSGNSFFGSQAGDSVTSGAFNAFFGRSAGAAVITGSQNSFFGYNAGLANTAAFNSFFGAFAGDSNTTGANNSFFGNLAGNANVTGNDNAFFGYNSGLVNNASSNSFFGSRAGDSNTTGNFNAFFGTDAGPSNASGAENAFFGAGAGNRNTASSNSFYGYSAGFLNTSGANNVFIGHQAGSENTTGSNNTFIGNNAGANITGSNNTLIGAGAQLSFSGLTHATAIGAGASVPFNNYISIGRTVDTVGIAGNINVNGVFTAGGLLFEVANNGIVTIDVLATGGSTELCRNADEEISTCSSSLRYKNNIQNFTSGLNIVRRLRPITFNWNVGGMRDVGFGAEEVSEIEPLLATHNNKGEIEGVKYKQITTVLVNAVNEQQTQIEKQQQIIDRQQRQIDELKQIVCSLKPDAAGCKEINK